MTHICVPIFVNDIEQAKRDADEAFRAGSDLVEFRVDTLTDPGEAETVFAELPSQSIVTCRPTWEGGRSELLEVERHELLAQSVSYRPAYMDVELAAKVFWKQLSAIRRDQRPGLIISSHDFTGRPDRLYNIIAEMNEAGGDVNKIAWTARSIRDNLEAFEILQQRTKPTIALCMGEAGLLSRVLAKKFGAFLTFASLNKEAGTAPGQVTIADMKNLYRWDAIGPNTRVYGVVGSPVAHSMSPAIHNAAFAHIGHDGVYLPMLVEPGYESFKAFMETFLNFKGLDLAGLSITIPHKENALRYLKEKGAEVEPLAEAIGVVNTVVIGASDEATQRRSDEGLRGFSSDYSAILDSITSAMKITREQLADYRVAVIGAGGTGRTAVAALAHYGATVVIYNRTMEKAEALAKEFNGKSGRVVAARLEKLCDSCCHIFINTTSVGMHPNIDQSPLGERLPKFTDETVVFDAIYNPATTKLLKQAEAAGAKTIGGVEMFIRQAAGQFEAWTGEPAPTELMRRVLEERLNAATAK